MTNAKVGSSGTSSFLLDFANLSKRLFSFSRVLYSLTNCSALLNTVFLGCFPFFCFFKREAAALSAFILSKCFLFFNKTSETVFSAVFKLNYFNYYMN